MPGNWFIPETEGSKKRDVKANREAIGFAPLQHGTRSDDRARS